MRTIGILAVLLRLMPVAHACPNLCDCRLVDNDMVVNCRRQKLAEIPSGIPTETVKLMFGLNKLTHLASSSFPPLPELRVLQLDSGDLVRLGPRAFSNLPALRELQLQDNQIEDVHPETFHGVPHLVELNLSSNKITVLPSHLFSGLALEKVTLDQNLIEQMSLYVFRNASIGSLILDHNYLRLLPVETFRPLRHSLKRFSLSHNKHHALELEAGVFDGFHLDELALSANRIVNTAFIQTLVVIKLDFSGNPLSSFALEFETLTNLAYVQHVRLRDVGADRIRPQLFVNLRALKSLDLTNNTLTVVDSELFRETPNITVLLLSENHLNSLPMKMSDTLTNLEELRLNENLISTIRLEDVSGLSRLKILDLRHNRLQVLSESLLDVFSAIPDLYLHENSLHCNCEMRWFRRWMDTYRSFTGAENCVSPLRDDDEMYIWSWREEDFTCTSPMIVDVSAHVAENDTLLLRCEARADPAPEVTWTLPSGDVTRTHAPSDRAVYVTSAKLVVPLTDPHYGGSYTCTATNIIDVALKRIYVNLTTTSVMMVPYATSIITDSTISTLTTDEAYATSSSDEPMPTARSTQSTDPPAEKLGIAAAFKNRTMVIIWVCLSLLILVATLGALCGAIPSRERKMK